MRCHDEEEAKRLNAKPWQIALLDANPSYPHWGPHEDYMWKDGNGWDSSIIAATWAEFGPWRLDELNECVNFYFSVNRTSEQCKTCEGNGYHPDAQRVVNTFYRHQCSSVGANESEAWNDQITQDECDALIASGRIQSGTTAEEVNRQNHQRANGFLGHDAINRCILIEARLKRLGIQKTCPACDGDGYIYTEAEAHVSLTLWWLHPRKGCSRGIEVTRIRQEDLPAIQAFLKEAAERNSERFKGVSLIVPSNIDKEQRTA